jgi:prepilin-type N-terminal cleavage/methylation domain-containing protein
MSPPATSRETAAVRADRRGFSLVELIVVVVMLGIVATIGVVGFMLVVNEIRWRALETTAQSFDSTYRAVLVVSGGSSEVQLVDATIEEVGPGVDVVYVDEDHAVELSRDSRTVCLTLATSPTELLDGRMSRGTCSDGDGPTPPPGTGTDTTVPTPSTTAPPGTPTTTEPPLYRFPLVATGGAAQITLTFDAQDDAEVYTGSCWYTGSVARDGLRSSNPVEQAFPIAVTQLENGQTYDCQVVTDNDLVSIVASATPVAPDDVEPFLVTADPGNAEITVSFATYPDAASYLVRCAARTNPSDAAATWLPQPQPGGTQSVIVDGLTNGVEYGCSAVAGTPAGVAVSNTAYATPTASGACDPTRKLCSDPVVTNPSGGGLWDVASYRSPHTSGDHQLFFVDRGTGQFAYLIDSGGRSDVAQVVTFTGPGGAPVTFSAPAGLTPGPHPSRLPPRPERSTDTVMYLADAGTGIIWLLDPQAGAAHPVANGLDTPSGLVIADCHDLSTGTRTTGDCLFAATGSGVVAVDLITTSGRPGIDTTPTTMTGPASVKVSADLTRLWSAETTGLVRRTFTGSSAGTAAATTASGSAFIPASSSGSSDLVVFVDAGTHQVKSFDPASPGAVTVVAGTGTAGYFDRFGSAAAFNAPRGIHFHGNWPYVYVADTGNRAIRRVNLASGEVTTVFGSDRVLYCNGADGSVTVTATTTLARDMCFQNLTVTATGVLRTNGYRVYVNGTMTVDGVVHNGRTGTAAAAGTVGGTCNTDITCATALGGSQTTTVLVTAGTPPTSAREVLQLGADARGGARSGEGGGVVVISARSLTGTGSVVASVRSTNTAGGGSVNIITASGQIGGVTTSVAGTTSTNHGSVRVFAPTGAPTWSCAANGVAPSCAAVGTIDAGASQPYQGTSRVSWRTLSVTVPSAVNIYRSDNGGAFTFRTQSSGTQGSWVDTGLTTGTVYQWRVVPLNAGAVAGTAVTTGAAIASSAMFGTGQDGSVTLPAGVTTLTRDMHYANLTVPAGTSLKTGGYRIFVSGTLILDGSISNNGGDGSSGGSASSNGSSFSMRGTLGGGCTSAAACADAIGGSSRTYTTEGTPPQDLDGVIALDATVAGGGSLDSGGVVLVSAAAVTGSGAVTANAYSAYFPNAGGGAVVVVTADGTIGGVTTSVNQASASYGSVRVFDGGGTNTWACNANGASPSCAPPGAVTIAGASQPYQGSAAVTWRADSATGAAGVDIYRSTNGGSYMFRARESGSAGTWADSGVVDGTTYQWRIVPLNAGAVPGAAILTGAAIATSSMFGTGQDGSATISATTTLTRDMHYTNLTVDTGVTLRTGGFRIFATGTVTINGAIAHNGGAAATGTVGGRCTTSYQCAVSLGGGVSSMATGGTAPASAAEILSLDGSVRGGAGTGYGGGVVVIAASTISGAGTITANSGGVNGQAAGGGSINVITSSAALNGVSLSVAGNGTGSFPGSVRVVAPSGAAVWSCNANTPCMTVGTVSVGASQPYQGSATVTWATVSGSVAAVNVARSADGGAYTHVATLAAGTQSFVDTGLTTGVTYRWRITPLNAGGVAGTAVITGAAIATTSVFGTGQDGAAAISANTTLTRDMHYTNLTVNAGVTLNTGGYRIFATGTVTLNGTVHNGTSTVSAATGTLGRGCASASECTSGIGGNGAFTTSGTASTNVAGVLGLGATTLGGSHFSSTYTGGGVVVIAASTVTGTGAVRADGWVNSTNQTGGGAVYVITQSGSVGSVTLSVAKNGTGTVGRTAVYAG